MTVFAEAIDDLFADPNLAVDAVYTPPGGAGVVCRIMLRRPDVGDAGLSVPVKGGTFAVGATVYFASVGAAAARPGSTYLAVRDRHALDMTGLLIQATKSG